MFLLERMLCLFVCLSVTILLNYRHLYKIDFEYNYNLSVVYFHHVIFYLTWFKNNKNRVATFIQAWYPQANEPPNYIHVPNHINKQVTKVHNN